MAEQLSPAAQAFTVTIEADPYASSHVWLANTRGNDNERFFEGDWAERFYPGPHQTKGEVALRVLSSEGLIAKAQAHFAVLANTHHVTVAETYLAPGQRVVDGQDRSGVRGLVRIIEGRPLLDTHAEQLNHTDQTKLVRHANSLLDYLDWVITAQPDYYLADIFRPSQAVITADDATVVDTDPVMEEPTPLSLFMNVRDVAVLYSEYIAETSARQQLRVRAGNLMQILAVRSHGQFDANDIAGWLR